MKKIWFLLLTVITFTACGGDDPDPIKETPFDNWNDPTNPNYTDGKYNPIAGEWQLIQRNGAAVTDFLLYKFDSKLTRLKTTVEPADEKEPAYSNSKPYIISNKQYKIDNTLYSYAIAGTLESARLTITEGNITLTFKPYESKVWSWKGDWNSPTDPHYNTYKGKYNPIKGTWKLTHVGENAVTASNVVYTRFNEDFTVEESNNGYTNFRDKHKYWINDIGIRENSYAIHPSYTFKYKIEGNTLYYQAMLPGKGNLITYSRLN